MRALRDFLLEPAPARPPTAAQPVGASPPSAPPTAPAGASPRWEAPAGTAARDPAPAHPSAPGARTPAPFRRSAREAAARGTLARPRVAAVPAGAAVLCAPAHAWALGAAVALLLRRRARASAGLVVVWGQPPGAHPAPTVAAAPAARRLAATLAGRGLEAHATGMLAVVVVPADPVHGSAAAARAIAAGGAAPSVLALGCRDARFDALLGQQDRVLVTVPLGAAATLAPLAVAGLASIAADVRACHVEPSSLARAVTASGTWVPATIRRPLREALFGLES
jgi:hypothetical protein